jgi:hypothetical protein
MSLVDVMQSQLGAKARSDKRDLRKKMLNAREGRNARLRARDRPEQRKWQRNSATNQRNEKAGSAQVLTEPQPALTCLRIASLPSA